MRNLVGPTRRFLGYTQEQIALALGCDRSTVSLIENGKKLPDKQTAEVIAKILQQPLEVLFPEIAR